MKRAVSMLIAIVFAAQVGGPLFAGEQAGCKCCGKDGAQCRMEQRQGKMQEKRLERLTKELNLTPEQKDKVAAILKENGDKAKAEMQKTRETVNAMLQDTNKQIEAVLTPEQTQKFEKMQAERKAKMEKKFHHEGDEK